MKLISWPISLYVSCRLWLPSELREVWDSWYSCWLLRVLVVDLVSLSIGNASSILESVSEL